MKRILIADDHSAVRACLRDLLTKNTDWEVYEAEDGRDAISKAGDVRPDLILLDLSMPVMNGLDAARQLRRIMPAVPLVLWTAFQDPEVERLARDAGFNAVAAKSAGGPVLLHNIQKLLPIAA